VPRGDFKWNPALQLAAQFPIVALRKKLLVVIERDVVLHQDGFAGGQFDGVLGHLRKFELHDAGFPLSYRLAQCGVKTRANRTLPRSQAAGGGQQV